MRTPPFARLILAASAAALVAASRASVAEPAAAPASAIVGWATAAVRDVTIPSGTVLQLTLSTPVASDTSEVEDAVAAELTNAVMVGGRTALPSGALVAGVVRAVDRSGRVKVRARVALDFTSVTSGGRRYAMTTERLSRQASATTSEDATKIVIGAGAGTGLALATRGDEVRYPSGADVSIRLTAPLTVGVSK